MYRFTAEKVADRVARKLFEKEDFVNRVSKTVLARMVHRDVSDTEYYPQSFVKHCIVSTTGYDPQECRL